MENFCYSKTNNAAEQRVFNSNERYKITNQFDDRPGGLRTQCSDTWEDYDNQMTKFNAMQQFALNNSALFLSDNGSALPHLPLISRLVSCVIFTIASVPVTFAKSAAVTSCKIISGDYVLSITYCPSTPVYQILLHCHDYGAFY